MPADIERAFAASGRRLFPFNLQEVRSECNCPDKANPCKHISAIYFLMGDRFSEDPFVLFQLRGRTRSKLIEDLAKQRRAALKAIAKEDESKRKNSQDSTTNLDSSPPPHPAVLDPSLWWKYEGNLHADLVVITPAMEGDSGLHSAGALPLAEEPRFPEARQKFLSHLHSQGAMLAQKAMLHAMAAGE